MPARLSDAETAHFRAEGYVKGIRGLEPVELEELREKYPAAVRRGSRADRLRPVWRR